MTRSRRNLKARSRPRAKGTADASAATVEGEAEGNSSEDEEVTHLTGLAFMEGHIRAGLALYVQGDIAAAKTHMGHPIEGKYEAVEDQLESSGHGVLEGQIEALAAEAEADLAELEAVFAEVRETMEAVRADYPANTASSAISSGMSPAASPERYPVFTMPSRIARASPFSPSRARAKATACGSSHR